MCFNVFVYMCSAPAAQILLGKIGVRSLLGWCGSYYQYFLLGFLGLDIYSVEIYHPHFLLWFLGQHVVQNPIGGGGLSRALE